MSANTTPEELKALARKSSLPILEKVKADMTEAAKQGSFSEMFSKLPDAVVEMLREEGFSVVDYPPARQGYSARHRVSIGTK